MPNTYHIRCSSGHYFCWGFHWRNFCALYLELFVFKFIINCFITETSIDDVVVKKEPDTPMLSCCDAESTQHEIKDNLLSEDADDVDMELAPEDIEKVFINFLTSFLS